MVACLADESMASSPCVPACQNCGRDLIPEEKAPDRARGRRFWARACTCVLERAPEPDYGFSATEISKFKGLLIGRGCNAEVADVLAPKLLNSLAYLGTKVVLGLPDRDVVVAVDDASALLGRDLRALGVRGPVP